MKNRYAIKIMILVCGLSGLFLSALAEQPLIVEAGFAPPYYTVDGEKVSGILVDMVSRVLDEAGIPFSIKAHPTKRVYRNLINGTGHIFLGPLKPEFPDFGTSTLHSSFCPMQLDLRCFMLGQKSPVSDRKSLAGKNVLIRQGYTYGGLANFIRDVQNRVNYYEVASFEEGIRMLQNRRADYFIDYRESAEIYLKKYPLPDLEHTVLSVVDLYFIVSRKTPDAEKVLARMEAAFRKLKRKEGW